LETDNCVGRIDSVFESGSVEDEGIIDDGYVTPKWLGCCECMGREVGYKKESGSKVHHKEPAGDVTTA
jgi:hypothetical protein